MAPDFGTLYDRLINGDEKLAFIGLGYVGMPIAVEFAKHIKVIGFNHNERRIKQYKSGVDPTHEVGDEAISKTNVDFTSDETRLREAKFFIVAVPTPINTDHTPDLYPVENASRIVGRNLTPGSVDILDDMEWVNTDDRVGKAVADNVFIVLVHIDGYELYGISFGPWYLAEVVP